VQIPPVLTLLPIVIPFPNVLPWILPSGTQRIQKSSDYGLDPLATVGHHEHLPYLGSRIPLFLPGPLSFSKAWPQ
jgi:hypothetical protein